MPIALATGLAIAGLATTLGGGIFKGAGNLRELEENAEALGVQNEDLQRQLLAYGGQYQSRVTGIESERDLAIDQINAQNELTVENLMKEFEQQEGFMTEQAEADRLASYRQLFAADQSAGYQQGQMERQRASASSSMANAMGASGVRGGSTLRAQAIAEREMGDQIAHFANQQSLARELGISQTQNTFQGQMNTIESMRLATDNRIDTLNLGATQRIDMLKEQTKNQLTNLESQHSILTGNIEAQMQQNEDAITKYGSKEHRHWAFWGGMVPSIVKATNDAASFAGAGMFDKPPIPTYDLRSNGMLGR